MAEYNSESEVDIESSITTRSGRTLKVSNVTENTDRDIDGDEEEPTTPSVTTRSGMVVKVAIEAKNNTRDIDEDEDEKEPTTPVPSDTLSKETRKLRKKKQLTDASEEEQEYVSDEELSKIKSGKVAPSGQCVDDEDIDGVDTDDLLEEVDQLPRLRKTLQKKKRITRKTKTSRKRSKSSTPLIKPEAIKKVLILKRYGSRIFIFAFIKIAFTKETTGGI
jgi:hypothetical protein